MHGLLMQLADTQAALANSAKARAEVGPVPRLSEEWVRAADDGSAEFRIAKALAGLQGVGDQPLPLCAQLFPVARQGAEWLTPLNAGSVRVHLGRKGRLVDVMGSLLAQRLQLRTRLGMQDKPLSSPAGATLEDVAVFLQDDCMDGRIAALLLGLSLCRIPLDPDRSAGAGTLPAAFGLMKLALLPDAALRRMGRLGEVERLPVPTGMLAALRAGDHGNRAVGLACRRLRASGLAPRLSAAEPLLAGVSPARAAAALLIPLRWGASAALARRLLADMADEADASIH
jgi:CRISPR-associated protein Csx17